MSSASYPSLPPRWGLQWRTDLNGNLIPKPSLGFYWCMPFSAECVFSPEKRQLTALTPDGTEGAVLWSDWEIERSAVFIRAKHPHHAANLVRPSLWEDLYRYFDARDLWENGAWNMWHVVQRLSDENEGSKKRTDHYILEEIDSWVIRWCGKDDRKNLDKLIAWDGQGDVLGIFNEADWSEVQECEGEALDALRRALRHWHELYTGGHAQSRRPGRNVCDDRDPASPGGTCPSSVLEPRQFV